MKIHNMPIYTHTHTYGVQLCGLLKDCLHYLRLLLLLLIRILYTTTQSYFPARWN